jgi:hypothetical protein
VELSRNCTPYIERQIQDLVLILIRRHKCGIKIDNVINVIKTYTGQNAAMVVKILHIFGIWCPVYNTTPGWRERSYAGTPRTTVSTTTLKAEDPSADSEGPTDHSASPGFALWCPLYTTAAETGMAIPLGNEGFHKNIATLLGVLEQETTNVLRLLVVSKNLDADTISALFGEQDPYPPPNNPERTQQLKERDYKRIHAACGLDLKKQLNFTKYEVCKQAVQSSMRRENIRG